VNRIRPTIAIVGENPSDIFLPLVDYRFDQYPDLVLFYPRTSRAVRRQLPAM